MHSIDPKISADDELWSVAVKREMVLRSFLKKKRLSADEVSIGCKHLGIKPAYLYRLLNKYRKDQRASSLLPQKPGPSKGVFLLPSRVEEIIQTAIRNYYLSKQKPRVSKLCRIIAQEVHKAGLPCPSRKAIDLRIKAIDPRVPPGGEGRQQSCER